MTARGLASLVELAVAEVDAIAVPGSDEETEANRTPFIPRPHKPAVLVVLEHGLGARFTLLTHLGAAEPSTIER